MTGPDEQTRLLVDGVWTALARRGIPEGSPQDLHVSWRCPSVAAAEALEAELRAGGSAVGVAQPNAEAGGRGYGVAVTAPVRATRGDLEELVATMIRLGAAHGALVVAVGTAFEG